MVHIEQRLKVLEEEVARLKATISGSGAPAQKGWKHIVGSFANDPVYDEAMRLGRQYRESLRPKAKKGAGRDGRTRHRSR